MKRLLLFALLMTPPLSCGGNSPGPVAPKPLNKCKVHRAIPAPALDSLPNLNAADMIELAKYIHNTTDINADINACNLVERIDY